MVTAHTDIVVQTRAADENLRHEVLEVRVLWFYSTCWFYCWERVLSSVAGWQSPDLLLYVLWAACCALKTFSVISFVCTVYASTPVYILTHRTFPHTRGRAWAYCDVACLQ